MPRAPPTAHRSISCRAPCTSPPCTPEKPSDPAPIGDAGEEIGAAAPHLRVGEVPDHPKDAGVQVVGGPREVEDPVLEVLLGVLAGALELDLERSILPRDLDLPGCDHPGSLDHPRPPHVLVGDTELGRPVDVGARVGLAGALDEGDRSKMSDERDAIALV